jgi:hypothetical protein
VLRHGRATLVDEEEVFSLADASARRLAEKVALPPASIWTETRVAQVAT